MKVFGDKNTFALEIGNYIDNIQKMRVVNIFVDGKNICNDDNSVYVPQFVNDLNFSANYLKKKIDYIKFEEYFLGLSVPEAHEFIKSTQDINSSNHNTVGGSIYDFHRFLDWGVTTDNVVCFLIPVDGFLFLTCEFWEKKDSSEEKTNRIFGTAIAPYELIKIIESATDMLKIK